MRTFCISEFGAQADGSLCTAAHHRRNMWSDGVIEGGTPVTVEKATEPFFTEAI